MTIFTYCRCWISNAEYAIWTFVAPAGLIILVSHFDCMQFIILFTVISYC